MEITNPIDIAIHIVNSLSHLPMIYNVYMLIVGGSNDFSFVKNHRIAHFLNTQLIDDRNVQTKQGVIQYIQNSFIPIDKIYLYFNDNSQIKVYDVDNPIFYGCDNLKIVEKFTYIDMIKKLDNKIKDFDTEKQLLETIKKKENELNKILSRKIQVPRNFDALIKTLEQRGPDLPKPKKPETLQGPRRSGRIRKEPDRLTYFGEPPPFTIESITGGYHSCDDEDKIIDNLKKLFNIRRTQLRELGDLPNLDKLKEKIININLKIIDATNKYIESVIQAQTETTEQENLNKVLGNLNKTNLATFPEGNIHRYARTAGFKLYFGVKDKMKQLTLDIKYLLKIK